MSNAIIDRWAEIVAARPGAVLTIAIIAIAILGAGGGQVETVQQGTDDFLPDTFPVMQAFDTIQAEFSSAEATTYTILIETDPSYPDSTEIRDIRDPRLLRYIETITNDIEHLDKVSSVSSPLDLFTDIPSSTTATRDALTRLGEPRWSQYISTDFTAARIDAEAAGLSPEEEVEVADLLRQTVEAHDQPAGIELTYTGQTYIDQAFQDQTNSTMSVTTNIALLGIFLVVIILFRSLYYGLTSFLTLVVGIVTGFGLFGYLGFNMSPTTSGAIAMGIGIAVDFGIQPVSRYLEEREDHDIEHAVTIMMDGVARPMTLGLIAALFGFASLATGQITFLSDLGILLSLTTLMAFIAAFVVLPPTMILYDRHVTDRVRLSMLDTLKEKVLP